MDVHHDLLAARDDQQIDVLDVAPERMHGDGLGQRELWPARQVEAEYGVAALLAHHPGELQRGQRHMQRVAAVPVEHRGDLAGASGTAGGALAELGARLGGQTDLGHGGLPWRKGGDGEV